MSEMKNSLHVPAGGRDTAKGSSYTQDNLFGPIPTRYIVVHNPPNLPLAVAVTEHAIAQVTEHADEDWIHAAREAGIQAARRYSTLTTDQIWAGLRDENGYEWQPHEPRAMSAVTRWLVRRGYIQAIPNTTRKTERPSAHRAPGQLYRSLICAP